MTSSSDLFSVEVGQKRSVTVPFPAGEDKREVDTLPAGKERN